MQDPKLRPGFLESWLQDLLDDNKQYGAKAIVPWSALSCLALASFVAWLIPEYGFWDKPEISMVFFTAILTLNGLLLALSWSSFGKIYEIASRPVIAKFLRTNGLLNSYIFHVDFIHYAQVFALGASAVALVACVIDAVPSPLDNFISILLIRRTVLVVSIASAIYALKYALGAVRIMQDLVWYSADPRFAEGPDLIVHEGNGRNRSEDQSIR